MASCARPMKYRVQIYDEEYLIQAKTLDSAIRGSCYAIRSLLTVRRLSALPAVRVSRHSTFFDDRIWVEAPTTQRGPPVGTAHKSELHIDS
jgi:hypothetical protein